MNELRRRAMDVAISMGLVKRVQSLKAKPPARKRRSLVKREIVYKNVKKRGQM
jgi:hypothetical protein